MCNIGRITETGVITARGILADVIEQSGPIPAARVSSAQARGAAKKYAYWGVVPYIIRRRQSDGVPTAVAQGRASSDRRSLRLAEEDLAEYCDETGRVEIRGIGELTEAAAEAVLRELRRASQ